MASTIRIDQVSDPLTVMGKEVYDPTGREEDIFAAVDLKMDIAEPTFTGVLHAPAGSVTDPSIQGPQGQGIHFGTNLVNIDCEDLNVWRSSKDAAIQTVDTHLIQARTPGSAGHGYPQLALRCMDTVTPSGAGPFIRFQSYNSAGELLECSVNAGLVDATDGAEDGGWDFSVYRAGVSEVAWAISGYEAMVGPTVDNAYDLGRASYRLNNGFVRQLRPGAGGVIWTSGSGSPEGVVTAPVGSLFTRTDGSTSTTLYVKTSGSGNTGWTAK